MSGDHATKELLDAIARWVRSKSPLKPGEPVITAAGWNPDDPTRNPFTGKRTNPAPNPCQPPS